MLAYGAMMQLLITEDTPEFGDVAITMAQAKVLHVLMVTGPIHMSELGARLRVTPSTTSGLVERLVEQGLATRADDPADRRQVVVSLAPAGSDLMERFRELNSRRLRELLDTLSESDLDIVWQSLRILGDATAARQASAGPPATTHQPSTTRTDRRETQ
jgi:DNA-binding MarR family transcriptional regulator